MLKRLIEPKIKTSREHTRHVGVTEGDLCGCDDIDKVCVSGRELHRDCRVYILGRVTVVVSRVVVKAISHPFIVLVSKEPHQRLDREGGCQVNDGLITCERKRRILLDRIDYVTQRGTFVVQPFFLFKEYLFGNNYRV